MISYGGVILPAIMPPVTEWLERNLSPADCYEFQLPDWPAPWGCSCPPARLPHRHFNLGSLYWPTGASRWSVIHLLGHLSDLVKLRGLIYGSPILPYKSLPLILDDGAPAGAGKITTNLYLLPPRPLAQVLGSADQLYLLTLVDARFFWWQKSTQVTVTGGTTTWADLFSALGTALGESVSCSVAADYLKPSFVLSSNYEFLPPLLDATCRSVGVRLVRSLAGTITLQDSAAAKLAQDRQLAKWPRTAGGTLDLDRRVNAPRHDLQGLVPSEVTVAFPRLDGTTPNYAGHAITLALETLNLTEYLGVTPRLDQQVLHSTCTATFAGGVTPTNATELYSLAVQIATDWYSWQLGRQSQQYAGIVPYEPEGLSDHVEWRLTSEQSWTAVERPAWNDVAVDFYHHGTGGALEEHCGGGVWFDGVAPQVVLPCLPPSGFTFISAVRCEAGNLNVYQRGYNFNYVAGCLVGATSSEVFVGTVACCDATCAGGSGSGLGSGATICCAGVTIPYTLCLTMSGPGLTGSTSIFLHGNGLNWQGDGAYVNADNSIPTTYHATLVCSGDVWYLQLTLRFDSLIPPFNSAFVNSPMTSVTCSPFVVMGSTTSTDLLLLGFNWTATHDLTNCGADPGSGGIVTDCCPLDTLAATLTATIPSACGGPTTMPLTYAPFQGFPAWEGSATVAGHLLDVLVLCVHGTWTAQVSCAGVGVPAQAKLISCNPFQLVVTTTTATACCTLAAPIVITGVTPGGGCPCAPLSNALTAGFNAGGRPACLDSEIGNLNYDSVTQRWSGWLVLNSTSGDVLKAHLRCVNSTWQFWWDATGTLYPLTVLTSDPVVLQATVTIPSFTSCAPGVSTTLTITSTNACGGGGGGGETLGCTFCPAGIPATLVLSVVSGCPAVTSPQNMVYNASGAYGAGWYTTPETIGGASVQWFAPCSYATPDNMELALYRNGALDFLGNNPVVACEPFDSGNIGFPVGNPVCSAMGFVMRVTE